ncbi:AAA family ATPase [Solirubrobacter phytolaccae]|uniref:AAA family ATPase n=1 Tax=Solirubrobacter phytolaccae TaxID=1404360 RepID=A0A9X3N665_9ACTN|nr:LuxR family transcriptional regulator [Solirubrobacter phytolaccae]MDA0180580.1 AAA family ATPase [Solirubrobacter phytolaccae]
MPGTREVAVPLVGRDEERHLLESLIAAVDTRGEAMVLRGEPGIGKSRLLSEAVRTAQERGLRILTTVGVQSEAHLPYAGLHQLLRPVRRRVSTLPPLQHAALDAAFGLRDDVEPEPFRIALAALDLLSEVAGERPVLVVVDDAQWLDRPTVDVLAFLARRIEADPILLLVAIRDGYGAVLGDFGLPEQRLQRLDEAAAAELLDQSAPSLAAPVRTRVLREAAGNPLAVLELPAAWRTGGPEAAGADTVPLTDRLERAFAGRVAELPDLTRRLLLVAASTDDAAVGPMLRAGGVMAQADIELDAIAPADEAGIVTVDAHAHTLVFRHPLVRSAVLQSASLADRQRAHHALASVLDDEPDRRAWHHAASLTGEDEQVAVELEQAAERARHRGALAVAVTALTRAAELGRSSGRARRLLTAAVLAVELGRWDLVREVLIEVERLPLNALERARVIYVEEMGFFYPSRGHDRDAVILEAAEHAQAAGDTALWLELLWLLVSRMWWFGAEPGHATRRRIGASLRELGGAEAENPLVFAIYAFADPLGHAAAVLDRLQRLDGGRKLDPDAAQYFGLSALVVGAFDLGSDLLAVAVDGLRRQGRPGRLCRPLVSRALMAARLGEADSAITAAEEGSRIVEEMREPVWALAAANASMALVAAMRGEERAADELAARANVVAEATGARHAVANAQSGRVLAALVAGRFDDAYRYAEGLFDPGDPAYHPVMSTWVIADLAEAASHVDELAAARRRVAEVEARAGDRSGTWVALALAHARALVGEPEMAGAQLERALASDLRRWPFHRARLQLAYGRWLRRERRVAESRAVLRTARDTFDALGCAPWGDQARQELRASGERSRRRVPAARDQLTAQELQIAQFAAEGLSNREIGQRLYLSHRTVSTHLYRIFPKLGISSRAELGAALSPVAEPRT